jgi:hypothetical protein
MRKKRQEVNWAMFAEWMIKYQLCRLNRIQEAGQNPMEARGPEVRVVGDKKEVESNEKVLPLKDMLLNHPSRNKSHPCIFNLEDLNEWRNILSILEVKCS